MTLTLHHGDCLELMKTLPDKSIDLFVCDLPYGCLSAKGNPSRKRFVNGVDTGTIVTHDVIGGCRWDVPIDLDAFWVEVKRLCKNDHTPVLMFCSTKFGFELINSNPDWFRYDLVWSKANAVGFLQANKMPMRSHEMIYVFSKKGANYTRVDIQGDFPAGGGGRSKSNYMPSLNEIPNTGKTEAGRRCVKSVIEFSNKKGKGNHPTQKPDDLYEWLITRYSKEGDTILDPTAGSFASCFTAQRLGRNAIGMEKDEGFYDKAKNLHDV
jgi:site-specific DNA-methyltransferase (adenine-specific)